MFSKICKQIITNSKMNREVSFQRVLLVNKYANFEFRIIIYNMNMYCCCLQKYVNKLIKIQNEPRG